eukprot:359014-Chlamydomonas_euryale.AAC.14
MELAPAGPEPANVASLAGLARRRLSAAACSAHLYAHSCAYSPISSTSSCRCPCWNLSSMPPLQAAVAAGCLSTAGARQGAAAALLAAASPTSFTSSMIW